MSQSFAFNLQIHTSRDSLEDVIPAVTETPITSSKISRSVHWKTCLIMSSGPYPPPNWVTQVHRESFRDF